MSEDWKPKLDDIVYMNQPDFVRPLGKVVGYVADKEHARFGQPIIEAIEDDPPVKSMFSEKLRHKKGDRFVIHPMFLLPFPIGGEEWQQAKSEGRIGR